MRLRLLAAALLATGILAVVLGAGVGFAQAASTVSMTEFAFEPDQLTVTAGPHSFTLRNVGRFPHDMHIEGNGVSEDIRGDDAVAPGQTFARTVTLAPGTYQVWCPVDAHRERGMVATLVVASAQGAGAPAPIQLPRGLPRTGELGPASAAIPAGVAVAGSGVLALGLLLRRRLVGSRKREG